jgi:hypothetical protein
LDHVCKIKIPTKKAGKAEKAEKNFFQPHWDLNPQRLTWFDVE